MPLVLGIDPGTVSIDLCGLEDGRLTLDRTLPTAEALADPGGFTALLTSAGPPDLVAGPSGFGLPLIRATEATERDLRLAFLAGPAEDTGGIGGLRRLARWLATSGIPLVYTPGVIHLPTVPAHRKVNRVDLGTADKVAAAVLGIQDQSDRLGCHIEETSFVLVELGGAFTAAIAVEGGRIVDGIGGTTGPMGWRSGGGWDGEAAFLAGEVTKGMLFRGGVTEVTAKDRGLALAAYLEGVEKAVRVLTVAVPTPREILLSGRMATSQELRPALSERLSTMAPVRDLKGFAQTAKQGAQGAAMMADGLVGGRYRALVEHMGLRQAAGTALDHLFTVDRATASRRLGLD
ncbi:MAG: DUF1464 family protein [Gemmatimonadales bacterium]